MRRVASIAIEGLLGRFNHSIAIDGEWEFVIVHGPNGVGKTRFLEVVAASLGLRPSALLQLPFARVEISFSDGATLGVSKERPQALLPETEPIDTQSVTFRLVRPHYDTCTWEVTRVDPRGLPSRQVRDLERFLPVEQVGPDMWVDLMQGDWISLAELAERYPQEVQFEVFKNRDAPTELEAFVAEHDVHLIETQRLLTFGQARTSRPVHPRHAGRSQRPTVLEFSEDLTRRIGSALAQNSRTSQELDRTFPRRVLELTLPSEVTDEIIRDRYERQTELRQSLAEIAVLDPSTEMPLPDRSLEPWEQRVLWTFLDDSEKKLATFQTLLDRVRLLREVVNDRFLFKELVIDSDKGFRFVTDRRLEVGPSQLSSGEQHQLVLLYDLLFNVKPNSLVLVDEPEISLHVNWQQKFLNDVQRIGRLADVQFIVATHSPQIVHTWWDRAVALYGEQEINSLEDGDA